MSFNDFSEKIPKRTSEKDMSKSFEEYIAGEWRKEDEVEDGDAVKIYPSKLFITHKDPYTVHRQYFAARNDKGDHDITFDSVAWCFVSLYKDFIEIGKREAGGIDIEEGNTERLDIYYNKNEIEFEIDSSHLRTRSGERNKSRAGIMIGYGGGVLDVCEIRDARIKGDTLAIFSAFDEGEGFYDLQRFQEDVEKGKVIEQNGNVIGLGFDKENNTFLITIYDNDGKPLRVWTIPKEVDTKRVLDELHLKPLVSDPVQPPDGIEGKSIGDIGWRRANLGKVLGIKREELGDLSIG